MSIYTKTGDSGTTGTFGAVRVSKDDIQIETLGSLDEASVAVGYAREAVVDKTIKAMLSRIQENLYHIMAKVAGAPSSDDHIRSEVQSLEREIDAIEQSLPKLTQFILPQGGEASVRLHGARVGIRRAERRVVSFLSAAEYSELRYILAYLNRASDYFFVLARKQSQAERGTK